MDNLAAPMPLSELVRELAVGEIVTRVPVLAMLHWNPSNIMARPGQKFRIEADDSIWSDDKLPCKADGQPGTRLDVPTGGMCRHREAAWFELVGTLGRSNDYSFRVGMATEWENTTDVTAELFFYANDVYFMYYNNAGRVMVTVTRLA